MCKKQPELGRDGLHSTAVIYKTSLQGMEVYKCMKEYYCNVNICRHHLLLQHFTHHATYEQTFTECVCCDVGAINVL